MAPRKRITVEELMGDTDQFEFDASPLESIRPDDIWANYDAQSDSLIVYITGKPVPGVNVWLLDNQYVVVDPDTRKIIGFYIEAFESEYVQSSDELRESWIPVKESLSPQEGWNQLLRVLAFWMIVMLTTVKGDSTQGNSFQPA